MRSTLPCVAVLTALSLANAPHATAQADRHQHDCKKAVHIVERGKPEKKDDWAWSTVLGCGAEGGVAARGAWLQARSETDTAQLEALYSRLWSFRDAALFDAARSLATDASASAQSRVYSSMLLIGLLLDNKDPQYGFFTTVGTYGVCRVGSVYDRSIADGTPLPSDARELVRSVGRQLQAETSAPAIVQSAGRCVDQTLMIDDRVRARGAIVPPEDKGL